MSFDNYNKMFWFRKSNKVPIGSLTIHEDMHTHLIPGVDDGRFTPESSADTIVRMRERGTARVCLTPHVITGLYDSGADDLKRRTQDVARLARERGAVPELILGAEYMVDEYFRSHIEKGGELLAMPANRVLIEMSYYGMSPQIFEVVAQLALRGYKPVLAHPERYLYMETEMEVFDRLHDMGCAFQLNLPSATGMYGDASIRIIHRLFERSYYAFAGSDMHSPGQFECMYGSYISEKIAAEGEKASLWEIA